MAILGLAEVDKDGNVNVSKFRSRVTGPGGFINITQSTSKIIFVGTFTTNNLKEQFNDGKIAIEHEGEKQKFVDKVEQITFSGKQALKNGQEVYYVTERCVFKLEDKGPTLIEIAPGINLETDIINQMGFLPNISSELKEMDERIFKDQKMDLQIWFVKNWRTVIFIFPWHIIFRVVELIPLLQKGEIKNEKHKYI